MKVLLAKRRALGDTVLLTSTIQLFQEQFPQAEIHVLVPSAFTAVVEKNPAVKNILSYESQGFFALLGKIRAEKYDYFFQLHTSPGERALRWLSGAKKALAHRQNAETEVAYGKHPNALEWDRFFLEKVFGKKISASPMPKLFLSSEDYAWGENFWRAQGADPKKIVFLGLGASRATKRWPAEHFARFAELISERFDFIPAIVHGAGEEEEKFAGLVADHLRARGFRSSGPVEMAQRFVFVTGLSVRELALVISATRAYVGNDSGPKHLAVALDVPSFTFFGPEDPVEWHPYSREQHPIFFLQNLLCRKEDSGRWCGIPVCETEQHRCMQNLDPIDALAVFKQRMGV